MLLSISTVIIYSWLASVET